MSSAGRVQRLVERAGTACFLALAVSLPLFESPKAIALVGFAVLAMLRLLMVKEARFPPTGTEIAVIAVMGTAGLSGGAALLRTPEADPRELLHGTGEVLLLGLTFLAVFRAGLSPMVRKAWLWGVLVSALLAIAWMAWRATADLPGADGLASVGNPNTSALYLAMVGGAGLALHIGEREYAGWVPGLLIAALTMVVGAMLYLGSRNAMLALALMLVALIVKAVPRNRLLWTGAVVVVICALVWLASPWMSGKFSAMGLENAAAFFGPRVDFWRLGAAMAGEFPLFGVGWSNFGTIDPRALGFAFPPGSEVAAADHAHNQALTVLAETGLVGFVAWIAFFALAGWALWRPGNRKRDGGLRLAGLSAWVVLLAGGAFEVTLVDEPAILGIVLIGLALAPQPDREISVRDHSGASDHGQPRPAKPLD
ncbi:MAG: hypothetical protein GVY13_15175 [Alphaproteobacteria bacterium]|jgi:O-antigen ligase|nr:hypothetical protein [Alphaproteobacteria bacterium]